MFTIRNEKDELVRVEEICNTKKTFFCDVPVPCYSEVCNTGTGALPKPVNQATNDFMNKFQFLDIRTHQNCKPVHTAW
jgi:hypothetical protein